MQEIRYVFDQVVFKQFLNSYVNWLHYKHDLAIADNIKDLLYMRHHLNQIHWI